MKCITKGKMIQRVPNEEAKNAVEVQGWKYTTKGRWKCAKNNFIKATNRGRRQYFAKRTELKIASR